MKKIAVILAGCGRKDGSEINEAVTLLLALDQNDCQVQCFAPNILQYHVVNHHTDEVIAGESRNVLEEAARLARGGVKPLEEFKAEDFDALIFSGGYGVAKNLCTYAIEGTEMEINPDVERAIKDMHNAGKPLGGMCIAPIMFAKAIEGAHITLGNEDCDAARDAERMGANHIQTQNGDVVVDNQEHIFTTPCYMLDAKLSDIYDDACNLVEAILDSMK